MAALNLTQKAKQVASEARSATKFQYRVVDSVRKYAMYVRERHIDLMDRFGEAYAILAKTMNEDSLKHVAAAIRSFQAC